MGNCDSDIHRMKSMPVSIEPSGRMSEYASQNKNIAKLPTYCISPKFLHVHYAEKIELNIKREDQRLTYKDSKTLKSEDVKSDKNAGASQFQATKYTPSPSERGYPCKKAQQGKTVTSHFNEDVVEVVEEEEMTPSNKMNEKKINNFETHLRRKMNKSITNAENTDFLPVQKKLSSKLCSGSSYYDYDPDDSRSALHSPNAISVASQFDAKTQKESIGKLQKTLTYQ